MRKIPALRGDQNQTTRALLLTIIIVHLVTVYICIPFFWVEPYSSIRPMVHPLIVAFGSLFVLILAVINMKRGHHILLSVISLVFVVTPFIVFMVLMELSMTIRHFTLSP